MASSETPASTTAPEAEVQKIDAPQTDAPNSGVAEAQTDGAFAAPGGDFIQDPEWDVEVKLKDLQADPNNPLYSIKSFNDLQLCVEPRLPLLLQLT